jgi:outer membrane protein assembly factor BamB
VDTPPTVHRGLCLFGSKSGWVYCLRADDGRLVWRLRAAPLEERIVAYGQLESPWPVPGSVLVVEDVAYFAAGRQPMTDGGILVFAVEPSSGAVRWVKRLNSLPNRAIRLAGKLDCENFDLLFRHGDGVAMSRWVFDRATGAISVEENEGFAKVNTGQAAAMVPRGGWWSYAPKQTYTEIDTRGHDLLVFRDNLVLGCTWGKRAVYRRDFNLEGGEPFDGRWWRHRLPGVDKEVRSRSDVLAAKATWQVQVFDEKPDSPTNQKPDAPTIVAMVLAHERLYLASSSGHLQVRSIADGSLLAEQALPQIVWDGMAIAADRLYVSTRDGQVVCLGNAGQE